MFSWFRGNSRRRKIREDRKYLEARARRFLKNYLAAEGATKHRYYEAVEGASTACHPGITNPALEDVHIAEATAEAALKVVKRRGQRASDSHEDLAMLITDAYARLLLHTGVPLVCTQLTRRCKNLGLRPYIFLRWQLHT